MAKATRVVPKPQPVLLELEPDEAQFLADVLSKISGHMSTSRRRHADNIRGALLGVDVDYGKAADLTGGLNFKG